MKKKAKSVPTSRNEIYKKENITFCAQGKVFTLYLHATYKHPHTETLSVFILMENWASPCVYGILTLCGTIVCIRCDV